MKYILLFIGVAIITYLLISLVTSDWMWLEKLLYFDPFGQTGFAPVGHNIIAPCKVLVQGSILFYPFRDSGFS